MKAQEDFINGIYGSLQNIVKPFAHFPSGDVMILKMYSEHITD